MRSKEEQILKIKQFWDDRGIEFGQNDKATLGETYLRRLEIKTIMNHIKKVKPENVLDMGCGNGYSTLQYALSFPNIQFTGLDYSEIMIENAKSNLIPS